MDAINAIATTVHDVHYFLFRVFGHVTSTTESIAVGSVHCAVSLVWSDPLDIRWYFFSNAVSAAG
jgi:hypothetical protein